MRSRVTSHNDQRRMYNDLNWIWPIISPKENYVESSENMIKVIRGNSNIAVKTALHIGCGGGHHDYTLKNNFEITGVDLSEAMLEHARSLNPEAIYHAGDMRTVRLGSTFDTVIISEAINYMLTEKDLGAAFNTAFAHLKPGGVFCTYAEYHKERFHQNMTWSAMFNKDDIDIVFIKNDYDPDTADTVFESTFVYLIRRDGKLEVVTDVHWHGIFGQETWVSKIRNAGFEVKTEESESGKYQMFICNRL